MVRLRLTGVALQLLGLAALGVGAYLAFGLGWALIFVGAFTVAAGVLLEAQHAGASGRRRPGEL